MSIPTVQPYDYQALFPLEHERLMGLLHSLTPADWQRATPCPGWDVHDLVMHLLGGSLSVISWHRDGFRGTSPPDGVDEQGFIDWLDELQDAWVAAARRVSPQLALELLEWSARGFAEAVSAENSAVTAVVSWASTAPVPLWLDHARELTEKWIHRQQLLRAVGRQADLREDLAVPVLEALRWAYPFRLSAHRRSRGAFVRISVDGEHGGRRWLLVSNGASWEFDGPGPTIEVASISLTVDQAWKLLTNNFVAAADGVLETSGDPGIISTLLGTRAIIGTPN